MRRFSALAMKEAAGIFLSPPILFATAFFVLLDSFAFYLTTAAPATAFALFDDIAMFMLFTSLLMFPLITMHSFSEDNATGTLETLLTAPIGSLAVVMAKFSGAMLYALVYLLHGVVYAFLLSYGGKLDWNSTLACFLALAAVAGLAISLGVFVSALTLSPAAAAAGAGGGLLFLALAADFDPYSGTLADILNNLSFIPHAKRWMAGELDTQGLVYFLSGTALFLFYAWLSVGSRTAGKYNADTTVRRRLTATWLLVSTGFLFLLLQAAILHINGFWESGTPLDSTLSRIPRRWLFPLALSVISFGWSCLTYRAARRADRDSRDTRLLKYATISETKVLAAPRYFYEDNRRSKRRLILAIGAAFAVAVNLNWLSHYPFRTFSGSGGLGLLTVLQARRWDISDNRRNSLSPTTRRTLDSLQGRLRIYCFLSDSLETQGVPLADEMRRLLRRYSDYNALVGLTFADALREPELAKDLAEELDIPPQGLEYLLVMDYQGRRMTIASASLITQPDWRAQAADNARWVFDGENRLTQTIMRLADPRIPNVVFTYGRLEHSLTAGTYPERSASRLARAMAGANMRVRQHAITPTQPIPPECDILAVISPREPYQKHEVEEIRRYLDLGGRLLLFAPVAGEEYQTEGDPLAELAFSLGGGFRDDMVEDAWNNDNGQALAPIGLAKGLTESSISLVFPLTRSIRDNPLAIKDGWVSERMVESHHTAVAGNGNARRPGPFTFVYRSWKAAEMREARVVVISSGRMAADSDIVRGANEALIMGLTQWLAGREESRDIAPRTWIDRRLTLTGPQLRAILWIGVVALPLAWLMAGISVWWFRKD
ncbi:MAG: Gldg family protein [Planctomycetes bacterium]|nr:Gldg family protein [Planctomycetota bacterium]